MTNETDKPNRSNQQHPSCREWMVKTSDPRTAKLLKPLSELDTDFWDDWDAEEVACAMAYFAVYTLDRLYAGDPNYDREMAFDQCMLAARRTVLDYAGCASLGGCPR
jgi:hypothetical protein